MFVIKASEYLIVRILQVSRVFILLLCHICDYSKWVLDYQNFRCMHGTHSACVPCLWSKQVSVWLSEFSMHAWCSFCFGAIFVIKACECLIVGILHACMVLILLLCYVCDQSEWVLDCQNFTCMLGAYCASVPCLSSKPVSAQLSESHVHAWCSFCFCAMFVTTGSECLIVRIWHIYGVHSTSVPYM